MRALVLGGYGFIGGAASVEFVRSGAQVLAVHSRSPSPLRREISARIGAAEVDRVTCPDGDPAALSDLIHTFAPDVMVSAVGSATQRHSNLSWPSHITSNVGALSTILGAFSRQPPERRPFTILIGSQAEYGVADMPWTESTPGQPVGPYGVSKLAATLIADAANRSGEARFLVLRAPIVFGPGQMPDMFVPLLIVCALRGLRVPMSSGAQVRRFVDSRNLARIIVTVADRSRMEHLPVVLNAPSFPELPVAVMADRILSEVGDKRASLERGALEMATGEALEQWPDDTRARNLGLTTTSTLSAAIADTVTWYRMNLSLFVDS